MRFFYIYFLLIVALLAELVYPASWWSLVGAGLMIVFIRLLARVHPAATAIAFPIILAKLLFIASLAFIASGYAIRELGIAATGSVYAGYYTLLSCAFLHLLAISFAVSRNVVGNESPLPPHPAVISVFAFLGLAFVGGAVAYLIILGLTSGFPLLDGTDRFAYRSQQDKIFSIVINTKPILAAYLGVIRFRLTKSRATQLLVDFGMAMLTISIALFGEKFLSVLVMVSFYLAPYLAFSAGIGRLAKGRLIVLSVVMTIMVSALTFYVYSDYGRLSTEETSNRLFGRFTGQGQLWYAVMQEKPELITWNSDQIQKVKNAMVSSQADDAAYYSQTGIFYLVAKYGAPNVRKSILEKTGGYVQFTGGNEAFLISTTGHITMIFILAIFALITGILCSYIYGAMLCFSPIGVIVGVFAFLPVYSMLNQASYWTVFGYKALLYPFIGICIDFFFRYFFSRKLRHANAPQMIKQQGAHGSEHGHRDERDR